MRDIAENIRVLHHASIRINGSDRVIYVDPFEIEGEPHDADMILITHDHYDHFSVEDIDKIKKTGTRIIVPEVMKEQGEAVQLDYGRLHCIRPGGMKESRKMAFKAIPAYNRRKAFHTKKTGGVGYLFELDGSWIYIAGDTDATDEAQQVKCDIALVPIGGKYTMDAKKAAELVNKIRPQVAIPTHYGSVIGEKEYETEFANLVDSMVQVQIKMEKY